ncbi:MAG: XdhC family protein [Pseudomonadota bacterium]
MRLDLLKTINEERRARRGVIIATELASGNTRLIREADIDAQPDAETLWSVLRAGKSRVVQTESGERFLTVHVPPPRIVCVGAVHISQALVPFARQLAYDLTIVDPRTAFATPERFPDVALIAEWPDEALPDLQVDRYTAFCALTHDPKIDDPGLIHALGKECFYIGALGSRKTHAKRGERLLAAGLSQDDIARIHAPIGLAIGAQSPSEIALSIMAEMTTALRLGAAPAKASAA